jgi:hypothetical protein
VILRRSEGGTVCIEQADHAALAGQLARRWGNERFGAPVPREPLELAAERHDDGMREFDRAPALDPTTGLPHTYLTMPRGEHMRAWERGTEALAEASPYAAVIVSLHRSELLERHRRSRLRGLLDRTNRAQLRWQSRLRRRLLRRLRRDPSWAELVTAETLERNRRLLRTWDRLSLALCIPDLPSVLRGVPATGGDADLSLRGAGGAVVVEPWPFDSEPVEVETRGRLLTERFEDEEEMRAALAAAPVRRLAFSLRGTGPGPSAAAAGPTP